MRLYLSSPRSSLQARACLGLPVLISYALAQPSAVRLSPLYSSLLIDPGAWPGFTRGLTIDLDAYRAWLAVLPCRPVASAAIDVIGDWRASLRNYDAMPEGFPTWHADDPPSLLTELAALALARRQWLGLSLGSVGAKQNALRTWRAHVAGQVRAWVDQVPPTVHIHGWALGRYARELSAHQAKGGEVSVDSTRWVMLSYRMAKRADTCYLSPRLRLRTAALCQYCRYARLRPQADTHTHKPASPAIQLDLFKERS